MELKANRHGVKCSSYESDFNWWRRCSNSDFCNKLSELVLGVLSPVAITWSACGIILLVAWSFRTGVNGARPMLSLSLSKWDAVTEYPNGPMDVHSANDSPPSTLIPTLSSKFVISLFACYFLYRFFLPSSTSSLLLWVPILVACMSNVKSEHHKTLSSPVNCTYSETMGLLLLLFPGLWGL